MRAYAGCAHGKATRCVEGHLITVRKGQEVLLGLSVVD